ncbi:MAG: VCBS repeat-containing protein [Planctomycetales bacterium]|nr:VCBS repeat-containing protein [Planctomycetales bacterium]
MPASHPRVLSLSLAFLLACVTLASAANREVRFKKIQLTDVFYAEGAGIADVNKDGQGDAVYGPYWYAGPDFKTAREIYPVEKFDPHKYSNNFITFVADINGDQWPDVLVNQWPGKDVSWYENPKNGDGHWQRHLAHPVVDNESPGFGDIDGDGKPDLVFHTEGVLGFAGPGDSSGTARWPFRNCSERNEKWQRYTHGLGYGDVNGDGRVDLLMAGGWWEQPAEVKNQPWTHHAFQFGQGGAQMHTYDVDGDGDNDVITSLVAHGYGLSWFEQVKKDGKIDFVNHAILPATGEEKADGLQFSQLHAVEVADVDGDGLKDIITGKRYWAHGPNGDADPAGPAVLYWFQLQRGKDGSVKYVAHQIDDDSGVGTQFAVGDLNGDKRLDIVTGNKKGGHVFLQLAE